MSRTRDDRIGRAQEEIADLGRELLELHQRMDDLLRLLESGAPGGVPAPLILEQRLALAEARLRRLERTSPEAASPLRAAVGKAKGLVVSLLGRAARRAFRTLKGLGGTALPPSEWIFETELVRRPPIASPAVTVVVTGGAEEEARTRSWLAGQTLGDVEVVVRQAGAAEPEVRGRWVHLAPPGLPGVPATFLEQHLWAAASEDLAFTTAPAGPADATVLVARDLALPGAAALRLPPAGSREPESCVVGRRIGGASLPAGAAAPPAGTVCVGGLWLRRDQYLSGAPLVRRLTPLDGLLPEAAAPGGAAPVVALVASRNGFGGTHFARELARALAPERPVVLVDTDDDEPDSPAPGTEDASPTYPLAGLLPPLLVLSGAERAVLARGARAVLDLRWQADPLGLASALRLRHPEVEVARLVPGDLDLPACLPAPDAAGPVSVDARASARSRLGVPEGTVAVVLLDTLDEDSGLFELVRAAGILGGQGGWSFLVAGNGPLRGFVPRLAAGAAAATIRQLPLDVPPGDVLAAADVFCLPGNGPFRAHLLLQALSRGLPCVSSLVTAGLLGAQGAVVDPGIRVDPAALAAALATLASPVARRELSARGLEAARAFVRDAAPAGQWRTWAREAAGRRP